MGKQWMELFTAELDVIEAALWQYANKRTTHKKAREVAERIISAITEKDEAWLVY